MGINQPEYQYKKRLEAVMKARTPREVNKPAGQADRPIGYKHYLYRMVGFEWRAGAVSRAEKGSGLVYNSYWIQQIKHMVYHESCDFDFDPGYFRYLEITVPTTLVTDGLADLPSSHRAAAKVLIEMVEKMEEDFVIDEKLFEDIHLCPRPRMRSTGDFDQPSCEVDYHRTVEELLSLYENPAAQSQEQLAEPVEFRNLIQTGGASVNVEPTVASRPVARFAIKVTPPPKTLEG